VILSLDFHKHYAHLPTSSFHFHSNKVQLIETIRRSKNGVVLADIKNCYEGIEADCGSMIVGGDIIAVKNKVEFKSLVLYPRGRPFLTKLSGTVLFIHLDNVVVVDVIDDSALY